MMSRTLAAGVLSAACVTAAGLGSYLAVRQNAPDVAPGPVTGAVAPEVAAVNESEGVVAPAEIAPVPPTDRAAPQPNSSPEVQSPAPEPRSTLRPPVRRPPAVRASRPAVEEAIELAVREEPGAQAATATDVVPAIDPAGAVTGAAEAPGEIPATPASHVADPEPVFDEIVIPASSVIGLELETTVTTERARVEDRVDARVTRDVYADGRLAIPAGSRVIGAVTLVERGGKVKERARLGVRFHTLVLAGGRQFDLRSEPIYREGESPANDSSRKIGGAAIGGAVLGAIIGGKKGAIIGGATGAAGGTAAVMAGDRKAATLASGSTVTVKLTAPVTLQVQR